MESPKCRSVSIHSLTQRETPRPIIPFPVPDVSIHSLTQRETNMSLNVEMSEPCFNPLPHAEGDSDTLSALSLTRRFNPLPHAEGDCLQTMTWVIVCVSIHSLTQRETPPQPPPQEGIASFNPLPHAEGDTREAVTCCPIGVSIHSLTQRETTLSLSFGRRTLSFNPLPHAEGDTIQS